MKFTKAHIVAATARLSEASKWLSMLLLCIAWLTTAALATAGDIFPVPYTGEDGATTWGYMNAAGEQTVGFFYTAAQPVSASGLAAVRNTQGQTALVNNQGAIVVAYQPTPLSISYSADMVAFRYETQSTYFSLSGDNIGTIEGAEGFFSDGLVRIKRAEHWGYARADGSIAITPRYIDASDFKNGVALAKHVDGGTVLLDTAGAETNLPADAVHMAVYDDNLVILSGETGGSRVYSLAQKAFITAQYEEIGAYQAGYALCKQGGRWGLLTARGSESIPPKYYYLTALGEGAYAARGKDGDSALTVVDGSGAYIYAVETYAGGFPPFQYGISWHGEMNGNIVLFNSKGVILQRIADADRAEIVGANAALVTQGNTRRYIRLTDGKTLYTPTRSYTLEGDVTVQSKSYEKYLGMTASGDEYGWKLEYPQFSGMADQAVQERINSAIERFFLDGPALISGKQSLNGSYGFTFQGRVLVVYADVKIGTGAGQRLWNDNIMLDYNTGNQYSAVADLLTTDYKGELSYPDGTTAKDYEYPRVYKNRLYLYHNSAATANTAANTHEISFLLSDISQALRLDSACYAMLTAPALKFADVPAAHWAYDSIMQAAQRGYMTGGEDGLFKPNAQLRVDEACATLYRVLGLKPGILPAINSSAWYAPAMGGLYEAGILRGLDTIAPTAPLSRAAAMQLIANTMRMKNPRPLMTQAEISDILANFYDESEIPAQYREAVAYCAYTGVARGTNEMITPNAILTRAAFAQMLVTALPAQ